MVYSYSYLSVIFKVSWSTDVAQNFQNPLIRSIHILASLIYSPGICFYDKYKDSFTHVRVLLYIWYGETVHRDVAAAPQTPQLGGAQANFGGPS